MVLKECVPYGSNVSAGTYECVDCGYKYSNQSKSSLPPCPQYQLSAHTRDCWKLMTGRGDSPDDPYPDT